jgi:ABC-type lipoprotein export system ATPase subunit
MAEIKMSVDILEDEYTKYVNDAFDLKCADAKEIRIPFNFKLENLHDWHIGVVCGASGSGKSTILKQLGGEKPVAFDNNKALISNFTNMRPEDAARMLTAIGLSSVPTWLRPYRLLSNGEQYRARMAKMISECQNDEILLVDEYTSVVDRNVAKSMSYALQKYIRRTNKRIIVFSCHFDIFDWLQPDWIYDLNKGGVLEKNVYLRQRPTVELQVFRVSTDTWAKFKKTSLYDRRIKRGRGLFRVRMGKQIGCVRKRFANAVGRVFKWVS